jgi:hypothetical protein
MKKEIIALSRSSENFSSTIWQQGTYHFASVTTAKEWKMLLHLKAAHTLI